MELKLFSTERKKKVSDKSLYIYDFHTQRWLPEQVAIVSVVNFCYTSNSEEEEDNNHKLISMFQLSSKYEFLSNPVSLCYYRLYEMFVLHFQIKG